MGHEAGVRMKSFLNPSWLAQVESFRSLITLTTAPLWDAGVRGAEAQTSLPTCPDARAGRRTVPHSRALRRERREWNTYWGRKLWWYSVWKVRRRMSRMAHTASRGGGFPIHCEENNPAKTYSVRSVRQTLYPPFTGSVSLSPCSKSA